MGIGKYDLKIIDILRDGSLIPAGARVMEIGAQQLNDGADLPLDAPYARDLWKSWGYKYACIDIDGSPDALPLDLNYDKAPLFHRGKYDLVTNFGTTEHIANQLNAFEVIHDLTKVNGIMLHNVPAQGYHTHGLVNYTLKFFWMLARSNNYKWHWMDFIDSKSPKSLPLDITETLKQYPGPHIDLSSYAVSDCGIIVALQKTKSSRFIPPVDVRSGEKTSNKKLKRRYPTVFS